MRADMGKGKRKKISEGPKRFIAPASVFFLPFNTLCPMCVCTRCQMSFCLLRCTSFGDICAQGSVSKIIFTVGLLRFSFPGAFCEKGIQAILSIVSDFFVSSSQIDRE